MIVIAVSGILANFYFRVAINFACLAIPASFAFADTAVPT
jgi:hypothetical protein